MITTWFEARTNDVAIDPRSQDGSLKQDAIALLLRALKLKTDK